MGVKGFGEYRKHEQLPRILLIIDEFQVLFLDDLVGRQAIGSFENLVKQGRAFGIHILLATQKLKGLTAHSWTAGQFSSLMDQFQCRIYLKANSNSSSMVGVSQESDSQGSSTREGIINNSGGEESADQGFVIPKADIDVRKNHANEMAKSSEEVGYPPKTIFFNSSELPRVPSDRWFAEAPAGGEGLRLHIGQMLDFYLSPLSIELSKTDKSNLILFGYDDAVHDGLLISIVRSLDTWGLDEIVYINGRSGRGLSELIEYYIQRPTTKLSIFEDVEELNLPSISEEFTKSKMVLIVDGLDSIKELRSAPHNPVSIMKNMMQDGPLHGSFVIAFADSFDSCKESYKYMVDSSRILVGFRGGVSALLKDKLNSGEFPSNSECAILCDPLRNINKLFRPYMFKPRS